MKRRIMVATLVLITACAFLSAQVPQGFNYQAVAFDASKKPIANTDLKVRLGFLSSIEPEILLWEEEHLTTTNDYGLFSIIAGDSEATEVGGLTGSFSEIPWEETPIFLRTSVYYESDWHIMGVSMLQSVPYALVTERAMAGAEKFAITGSDLLSGEPLFEVKRKDGVAVFAVYNSGARINVPVFEEGKAAKGGFAIGGFDESKALVQDFMLISPDSVRFYIDDKYTGKTTKGGFAIGGFDESKAGPDEYLRIMRDSTRIFVKEGSKATKGGFAIGSFDEVKSPPVQFMNVTPLNYFIGHESGLKLATGKHNSFMGYKAGREITAGEYNVFLGHLSGLNNSTGSFNVFVGNSSGYNNTSAYYNTFTGHNSGYYNTGWFNTYLGCNAGFATIDGSSNTFLGLNAGRLFEKGSYNTFIGTDAGEGGPGDTFNHGTTLYGNNNTALGFQAGNLITGGSNNVFIGSHSGVEIETGSGNVFIGYESGASETGDNKLYIANSDSPTPMMYGDFSTGRLGIGTKTLTQKLNVAGGISASGTIFAEAVNAPVSGNVTGNLSGNVTGNVTGDITGNLTGKVTGQVNDVMMGRILMTEAGDVITIGTLRLYWDGSNDFILVDNSAGMYAIYCYRTTSYGTTKSRVGIGTGPISHTLTNELLEENTLIELHVTDISEVDSHFSLWLQYYEKKLIGFYMK